MSLDLDVFWGYGATPDSVVVAVASDSVRTASFDLAPLEPGPVKVVLLEGFSNVSCTGCPAMSNDIHELMAQPGLGLDRVLLIKYSLFWPAISDPHYQGNRTDNDARLDYYGNFQQIPTFVVDGLLRGSPGIPPTYDGMLYIVEELLEEDPGVAVTVAADVSGAHVPATITISASRHTDLQAYKLKAALVENPVTWSRPPGDEGETVFHWIMHDFATVATAIATPGPDSPLIFDVILDRIANATWIHGTFYVTAFLQDDTTGAVLQAGSTASAASPSLNGPLAGSPPLDATQQPGGF